MGWFSATLLPSTRTVLACCMSIQWLVIAPRPNEAPRPGTVGAMSKSGLMLDKRHPQEPSCLLKEVALLVGVLGTAQKGDRVRAVYLNLSIAELLGRDPGLVADLLDLPRHPLRSVFPADLFPVVAARCPVARSRETLGRRVCREHGDAFHAQRPAVHDVVVVSFQISLPSRTAAIMPHPHEQKLQEVDSLTFSSFSFCVAALTVGMSINPLTARPAAAPTLALNQSRRLIVGRFVVEIAASHSAARRLLAHLFVPFIHGCALLAGRESGWFG